MYCFTDWVLDKNGNPDENVQYWYGVMMNCFFGYYIYANLGILLYISMRRYWLGGIKYYKLWKFKYWEQGTKEVPSIELINDPLKEIMKLKII